MNNRDKSIFGKKVQQGLIGTVILSGVALARKSVSDSNKSNQMQKNNNQIQKINSQIADIDRQINNYKSGLLGSWLNDTKIEELERQRKDLVKKRKKYE